MDASPVVFYSHWLSPLLLAVADSTGISKTLRGSSLATVQTGAGRYFFSSTSLAANVKRKEEKAF